MAPIVAEKYKDLLNPIKDPEQSFAVNISELLQTYIKGFVEGKVPADFNSAAMLLQGSSSIYGKKVEYLHNLATKLYASLVKNKKEGATKKETKEKEKTTKESKFNDPFFSTEIKPGKNLSCLRKKYSAKNSSNKKSLKKSSDKKYSFVPVDLLPLEGEEKGDVFYDTRGDPVGNKGDYTLNKCKVISSGWLLLPTVSPDLLPSPDTSSDYTMQSACLDDDDSMCIGFDDEMPESTPLDEGYPPSCESDGTPGSVPSSQIPSSQGTDEGMGSLPCTPLDSQSQPESVTSTAVGIALQSDTNGCTTSDGSSPTDTPMEVVEEGTGDLNQGIEGIENIPLDDAAIGPPPRRSMRQALKLCQLEEAEKTPNQPEENPSEEQAKEEVAVVKRAIQKKNTCILPSKLKAKDENNCTIQAASEFCARTFFALDRKFNKKNCVLSLGVTSFGSCSSILKRFNSIFDVVKAATREKKKRKQITNAITAEEENEEVDIENLNDPDPDDDIVTPALEAADIVIENNPDFNHFIDNENPIPDDEPVGLGDLGGEPSADDEEDSLDNTFEHQARMQCALFKEDLAQYVQTSDISEKVHEWEITLKPFLEGLDKREAFDINLYGSRILNSFGDTNRKQTITFRDFCKGKQKWEIHRYFMALLPLVNIGNVNIEPDKRDDGGEDILVTLLSRKMHHKELEEFGHKDGEHS